MTDDGVEIGEARLPAENLFDALGPRHDGRRVTRPARPHA